MDGNGVHVHIVDEHGAVGHVVGSQKQVHQRGLAGTGLAHQAHVFAGLDGKGHIFQSIEVAVGIAEAQVLEGDLALHVLQFAHAGLVHHVTLGIQLLADTGQGCLATGGHVDELRHSHDGPDDGGEIADEFHQLAGVEPALVNQIAAVTQNDADDALHEEHDHDAHQHRGVGELQIGLLIVLVQLPEGHQFLGFLHEGLDDRNTGEALLREIRKLGKCLLTDVPLLGQVIAQHHRACHQAGHGDQGQHGQGTVHLPHFHNGQQAQQKGIEEHHNAPAEAFLNGVQIVGEQTHQVAHFIHLVILPAQFPGMVKHPVAKLSLHPDGGAEEAHTPQKAADDHGQNNANHGHTDIVQQNVHGKGNGRALHFHHAAVHTVDEHAVQFRNDQLHRVHRHQCQQTHNQPVGIPKIVPVDMLAEYHTLVLSVS